MKKIKRGKSTNLNAFPIHHRGVHLENGRPDGAGGRQLGHGDVDRIGPLRVQDYHLLVFVQLVLLLWGRGGGVSKSLGE